MDFDGDNYEDRFVDFTDEEEHKLKYYELYQKFHDMFEKQLEIFCDGLGITQSDFLKRCRDATTKDKQVQRYMDILLSSVEYNTFVQLMKLMRPVALQRIQSLVAEAKYISDITSDGLSDGKYGSLSSPSKASKGELESFGSDAKNNEEYPPDGKSTEKMSK